MPHSMQHLEERIVAWAQTQPFIRALIVEGSMARAGETTEWSDLDVNVFATDNMHYFHGESWLDAIGEVWVCLPLENEGWVPTRLTWFAGGEKVDFALYPLAMLQDWVDNQTLSEGYQRGYRILLDKDGLAAQLPPSPAQRPPLPRPTPEAFDFTVREFWFESLHVAQGIRARDLWAAKFRGGTMRHCLLQMLEWHAQSRGETPSHIGKYLSWWTDQETWQELHQVWGHFNAADSWRAHLAVLDVFTRLTVAVAGWLGYPYDAPRYARIAAYSRNLYAGDPLT